MNITKDEYEKELQHEKKKNERLFTGILIGSILIGFGLGFLHSFGGAIAGIFIGVITGIVIGGNVTSLLSKRWELDIPYCIFSYFEEKNEQVISANNIGKMIQYGRVEYFQGSNYYAVTTDKENYMIEIQNEQVISCSIQKKSDLS